ncbi:hypothetical protein [Streptomyces sp. TP-A0874]|uniref:hypothetical protein n=1 Tax=Streptomyces sp. TP-A0874 TaxID=549819 RepID=UPI000853B6A2|nr:hypothetical protein [Streptomyces sp. TP-A0874]
MDPSLDVAALASTAAERLIELLTTDGWAAARAAVVSLWRRGHPERVEAELTEARGELLRAGESDGGPELRALLVSEWQARLARLLATHPDLVDETREMVGGLPHHGGSAAGQTVGSLHQEAHVTDGNAYLAGRDISVTKGGE